MVVPTLLIACLGASCLLPSEGDPPATTSQPAITIAELAGIYSRPTFGMGGGTLTLTAEGRFSTTMHSCYGTYPLAAGVAKVVNEHLLLSPDGPRDIMQVDARGFGIVRWGECVYFVSEADKEKFCDRVNQRDAYFWARVLVYAGPPALGRKTGEGLPSVPKDWAPLILQKPVQGKIIEIVADDRARVDLGAESGVWKGMTLLVDATGHPGGTVMEVGPRTCIVTMKYISPEMLLAQYYRKKESPTEPHGFFKLGQTVRSRERDADRGDNP
jgi:hypothetical protein